MERSDGQQYFHTLCKVYKRANRSYIAASYFHRAIQWVMREHAKTDQQAFDYICERARRYCYVVPNELQQGMCKWLEEMTFENPEESWPTGKMNGNGQSKVQVRDDEF